MKGSGFFGSLLAGVSLLASNVAADASSVPQITIAGKHFFYSNNGSEFFIRGVAYQQNFNSNASSASNSDYTDPLADVDACNRDIPYLLQLNTNLIRTYAIDPTKDHSGCMNALANAGIYVISDLSSPSLSINRDDAAWDVELFQRYTQVIDDLSQYNNVIGFFAGNEVTNTPNTTDASAFVKAAVRDSKAYIKTKGYKNKFVGYATYDGDIRYLLADYFNCGDQSSAVDFWGYNIYSWCNGANYQTSDYQARTQFFSNYSVPAFFAEYGCNTPSPRTFTEVAALYGPQMAPVWAGGIVYQYFQTVANYGLVSLNGNSVSKLPGFDALSSQMASASPSSISMSQATATSYAPAACPTEDSVSWMAAASPLPPSPNPQLCECLVDSLSCVLTNKAQPEAYGDLFGYVCGNDPTACAGIVANGTTGKYGAYSQCNPAQQLSFVMNNYYLSQQSNSDSCDFNGNATVKNPSSLTGTCSQLLAQAGGASGTGSVPSPTGSAVSVVATTASSTGSTHKSSAAGLARPSYGMSVGSVVCYVVVALASGAGMLLL